jgi:peptide chain release factor 2
MRDLQKRKALLEARYVPFKDLERKLAYLEESSEILKEEEGEMFLEEIASGIIETEAALEDMEIKVLLAGPLDPGNAIVTINPGAGGTENQGYRTEMLDLQPAEEAGIKSATFTVSGPFAYGYLNPEAGVHRLVRISPFDANRRRHTSFSAVLVYPDLEEEDIEIEVRDEDIRVDTFRASGAGGQHVNKTSSAVRITHAPSGIVVSCQSDRSQHRNREVAMKILKSRLYELERQEREREMEGVIGEKKEISWGSQIRSYVLHPYQMVKDHRTSVETGNVSAVLDGAIDDFIKAALKLKARKVHK